MYKNYQIRPHVVCQGEKPPPPHKVFYMGGEHLLENIHQLIISRSHYFSKIFSVEYILESPNNNIEQSYIDLFLVSS